MSDRTIEQDIQAAGNEAPRVTPQNLQDAIVAQYVFSGAAAFNGAAIPHAQELGLLTICVLVLQNGFTVVGKSACASPENYSAEIGQRLAQEDAERQVWPLLGYTLKQQLHQTKIEEELNNG